MKLRWLAVGLLGYVFSASALAMGGMAGYYQQLNLGSTSFPTSVQSNTYTPSTSSITSSGRTNSGGLSGYYESIGIDSSNISTAAYTPPTSTGVGGFSQFFQEGLQANSFNHLCKDVPKPDFFSCEGGQYREIKNNYGCTINWRCEGGNFCPEVTPPPAEQCNGIWKPQYQTSTQCLTHYFCDRTIEPPEQCPQNYNPVCGVLGEDTLISYSNLCLLKAGGAQFKYNGQCRETPHSTTPVIHSFSGPNQLKVNQSGTWTVRASGGPNANLSYDIDWGEKVYADQAFYRRRPIQTTTFTHQYAQEGTYKVRITVRNEQGQQATQALSVTVGKNPATYPPTIEYFEGPTTLQVGETGNWRVSASDPIDAPVEFAIDWGEYVYNATGAARTSWPRGSYQTFQHAYQSPGTYRVRVSASGSGGSANKTRTVTVLPKTTTNLAPVIHGLTGPTTLKINQTGTWNVRASDPQNQDLRYQINWGENIYAAQARYGGDGFVQNATFTHSYAQAGTYTVSVTVKNNTGKTAITTMTVRVKKGYQPTPYPYPYVDSVVPYQESYRFDYVPQFDLDTQKLEFQPTYRAPRHSFFNRNYGW